MYHVFLTFKVYAFCPNIVFRVLLGINGDYFREHYRRVVPIMGTLCVWCEVGIFTYYLREFRYFRGFTFA
jgi:hypothetical protein